MRLIGDHLEAEVRQKLDTSGPNKNYISIYLVTTYILVVLFNNNRVMPYSYIIHQIVCTPTQYSTHH